MTALPKGKRGRERERRERTEETKLIPEEAKTHLISDIFRRSRQRASKHGWPKIVRNGRDGKDERQYWGTVEFLISGHFDQLRDRETDGP